MRSDRRGAFADRGPIICICCCGCCCCGCCCGCGCGCGTVSPLLQRTAAAARGSAVSGGTVSAAERSGRLVAALPLLHALLASRDGCPSVDCDLYCRSPPWTALSAAPRLRLERGDSSGIPAAWTAPPVWTCAATTAPAVEAQLLCSRSGIMARTLGAQSDQPTVWSDCLPGMALGGTTDSESARGSDSTA